MTSTVAFIPAPLLRGRWEKDPESGSLARRAYDLDRSAVALHDAVRHEQSQAGSLRARRVERLEEVRQGVRLHFDPRIRDLRLAPREGRVFPGAGPHRPLPAPPDPPPPPPY